MSELNTETTSSRLRKVLKVGTDCSVTGGPARGSLLKPWFHYLVILVNHGSEGQPLVAHLRSLGHLDDVISRVCKFTHVASKFLTQVGPKFRVDWALINFKAVM